MSDHVPPGPPPPGSPPPPDPSYDDDLSPWRRRELEAQRAHQEADAAATPTEQEPQPVTPQSRAGLYLVLTVVLALLVAGGVWLLRGQDTVDSLKVGDCLSSDDLAAGSTALGKVDVVDCADPHDAQVVATVILDDATARDGYTGQTGAKQCLEAAPDLGDPQIELRPLAPDRELLAGDRFVCIARSPTGSQVTGSLL